MTKGHGTNKGSGSRVSRKRDPKTGLTAQQERFVILIVYGRDGKFVTQAGAYRLAYDCRRSSDVTIWKRASELMANRKVAGRIAELRNAVALQSNITRELETEKLDINWRRTGRTEFHLSPSVSSQSIVPDHSIFKFRETTM